MVDFHLQGGFLPDTLDNKGSIFHPFLRPMKSELPILCEFSHHLCICYGFVRRCQNGVDVGYSWVFLYTILNILFAYC